MRWRAGLSAFGFINLYFYPNGQFIQEVRFNIGSSGSVFVTQYEEVYKGSYSVSGDKLTFTYTSAEHKVQGQAWGTIGLPTTRTLTYTFGEGEYIGIYFDLTNGGVPPFNEPVTYSADQTSSDTPTFTRFVETNFVDTVFGR